MKTYLCLITAAVMLLLSACSDDNIINRGNDTSTDLEGQELIIRVVSSGDGLTTRAGRPLYSSEADQTIDKVRVATFALYGSTVENCVYYGDIPWSAIAKDYGEISEDQGKYASVDIKTKIGLNIAPGMDPGNYMVYAVGYTSAEAGSVYAYNPPLTSLDFTWNGSTTFESVRAISSAGGEEIFAGGIAKITVNADRNFVINNRDNVVYLHRQVAGAFGYFMNIPAEGPDGTAAIALRLVARDKNTVLNMTNFNTGFRTTDANAKYVVNGEQGDTPATSDAKFNDGTDGYSVYSITLSDWFTVGDTNSDGILNGEDTWDIPTAMKDDFNAVRGSVFGGEFLIPFANKNASTFELQLVAGDNILRYWTVDLENAQTGVVGADNAAIASIATENASSYSIVRNHLYSIGVKTTANPDNDTDPGNDKEPIEEPIDDEEDPADLSKGQVLTLRINSNWAVVKNLEVE
jgi:hypothetical protein